MKKATARRSVAATLCALCVVGVSVAAPARPEKVDANGPPPTTVPIRRLTNAEYMATVADLFPGYTLPEIVFVPDPKVLGFVNLSSSQTGSLVRMEQYESAAFVDRADGDRRSDDADRLRRRRAGRGGLRGAVPGRLRQARLPAPAHRRRARTA